MNPFENGNGAINTMAIHIHEIYSSYMKAGFSEEQAFELTRLSLMAAQTMQDPGRM